jgi:cysteine protease ATG4
MMNDMTKGEVKFSSNDQEDDIEDFEIIDKSILNQYEDNTVNTMDQVEIRQGDQVVSQHYSYKKNSNKKTLWGNIKSTMSNMKNNIKYNYFLPPNELNLQEHEWIRIFDMLYSTQTDNKDLKFDMSYIIWMSYRNGFNSIINEGKKYKTDCGWGCMIRCAQMMLARAIFMMKNNEFGIINSVENKLKKELDRKKIFDILILFFDNNLSYSELNEYKNSFCIMSKKTVRDFEIIEKPNSSNEISYLTPAFSIQNICKKGIKHGKGAGKWFSDVNMSSILSEINREINPLKGLQIIHFSESVLYESEIIKMCFEEKTCNCNKDLLISHEREKFYCAKCLENGILFDNKLYKFIHPGIFFISVRLGLEEIDMKYYDSILLLFNIPNNLGFIGGRTNKAYYFIGKTDDNKIIYLDPHYNQKNAVNIAQLRENVKSYIPDKLYKIDIHDISPAFSVGFFFRNVEEYTVLLASLTDFLKAESIFTLSAYPKHVNIKTEEPNNNIDGDYLLLNY